MEPVDFPVCFDERAHTQTRVLGHSAGWFRTGRASIRRLKERRERERVVGLLLSGLKHEQQHVQTVNSPDQ